MSTTIARIVGSNSHVDYIGRVIDSLDAAEPPSSRDFGFGQFVEIGTDTGGLIIGVIYDSKLINPEYASFGPRLSPRPALGTFSPDFINEQGILLGILLLGTIDAAGDVEHGVPRSIIPPGQEIGSLSQELVKEFHHQPAGVHLGYYPQVIAHAGEFAMPLLQTIIDGLSHTCGEADRQRLAVLKRSLQWQMTMGGMKL